MDTSKSTLEAADRALAVVNRVEGLSGEQRVQLAGIFGAMMAELLAAQTEAKESAERLYKKGEFQCGAAHDAISLRLENVMRRLSP